MFQIFDFLTSSPHLTKPKTFKAFNIPALLCISEELERNHYNWRTFTENSKYKGTHVLVQESL